MNLEKRLERLEHTLRNERPVRLVVEALEALYSEDAARIEAARAKLASAEGVGGSLLNICRAMLETHDEA